MEDEHPEGLFHEGDLEVGETCNPGAPVDVGPLAARFARYPGCQQLQVWLPQPGCRGYTWLRVLHGKGQLLEQGPLQERLSGSVQLLFDTLSWPPGPIDLVVEHEAGWAHRLSLHKFEGERPRPKPPPAALPSEVPIVYRDGRGRLLPNEDLELRQRAFEALVAPWLHPADDEPPDRDPPER